VIDPPDSKVVLTIKFFSTADFTGKTSLTIIFVIYREQSQSYDTNC